MEGHNESVFHPEALAGAGPPSEGTEASPAEIKQDGETLRPASLDEFLGQPRVVDNLRVALTASKGDVSVFITSPISLGFLILSAVSILCPFVSEARRRRASALSAAGAG